MKVLIGSRALQYWHPKLDVSMTADWDIISDEPVAGSEWHDPSVLLNQEFAERYATKQHLMFRGDSGVHQVQVMSLLGLALIKRSHLWRDLRFQKHITHFHKYLSEHLRDCSKIDLDYLKRRTALTRQSCPQGTPNLMQTKDKFFSDAVTKKYEHDWLHELFAYQDQPWYTRLLRNPELAWCDFDKWQLLTTQQQLECVAEEAYVIATERFLVPNDWKYAGRRAFMKAVDKVCTTLCSGWFRDFAIDHYPRVLGMFDQTKIDCVRQIINSTPEDQRRYHHGTHL